MMQAIGTHPAPHPNGNRLQSPPLVVARALALAPVVKQPASLLESVERDVISGNPVETPFGRRRLTYADYTASGKALSFVEKRITTQFLPVYANTHTVSSCTGLESGKAREKAREIIRNSVRGKEGEDVVLFTGNGVTAAVSTMLHLIRSTPAWERSKAPPVVIVGPYEHHSNILPWRESGALTFIADEAAEGGPDMAHVEQLLRQHATSSRLVIGSFSACANVTGIISDVDAIATLLHRYGALAFFDYAAGGPYMDINMNSGTLSYKDAVFLSPHKFVGGPGTPGVLVFKRKVVEETENLDVAKPSTAGGGTVAFVTKRDHRYLETFEEREEGGTPNIVGAVRCGLVFALKDQIGPQTIMQREHAYTRMALSAWARYPSIKMMGNTTCERVSIFSFIIEHTPSGYNLHHNFVSVLLNDLFGIQSRSGCACAGPYVQDLLGVGRHEVSALENCILQGDEGLKPGFTRLNLPFFISERVARFIINAVIFVAQHGWKLLPLYSCDAKNGTFVHRHKGHTKHDLGDLFAPISPADFEGSKPQAPPSEDALTDEEMRSYFQQAEQACGQSEWLAARNHDSEANIVYKPFASPEAEAIRWFLTPQQALVLLKGGSVKRIKADVPYLPVDETIGVPAFTVFRKAAADELGIRGIVGSVMRDGIQRAWASLSDDERALFHGEIESDGVGGAGGLSKMLCGLQGLGKMASKTWLEVRRREGSVTDRRAREAVQSSQARHALRGALASALPEAALRPYDDSGSRSRTSSADRSQASTPLFSSLQFMKKSPPSPVPLAGSANPAHAEIGLFSHAH